MRRRNVLAVGIGIYAIGLIVWAPATIIDSSLRQASTGRIRLAQARGTLWAGTGSIELRDPNGRNSIAKDLAWRVLPESLWRGRLVCEVQLEHSGKPFLVAVSPATIEIANAEMNLPAAAMAFAEPRLKPLKLSGDVVLRTKNLAIGTGRMLGSVTLQWRGAGSAFAPVSPIGSYELQLDGQGNLLRALLITLQGPLQLDGSGSWTMGRNPEFQATAHVPAEYRSQFTPLLRLISVQRDEGSFELQLK
jgi:general secretion pathway protein N